MKNQELVRLNVLLQKYGVASRRKADELIQSGAVRVDRKLVNTLGTKVSPNAVISIEGQELSHIPETATYLLHKPVRTITSRKDLQGRTTVYDLSEVKQMEPNVQAVGRLDYHSEGLLVMTNDGDLAYALSHPTHSVEKTYHVLISTPLSVEEVEKLRQGIRLEDGLAKPMSVKLGQKEKLGQTSGQWVELVVTEGRNRLIRRMMESLGLHVLRLVRVAIGDLRLPFQMKAGSCRAISQAEKKYLDSLKSEVLSEKKKSLKAKSKSSAQKKVKKVSLNDKEYQKHVQTRNIKNERISLARKSKLEEKILSKVVHPKKGDEIRAKKKESFQKETLKKETTRKVTKNTSPKAASKTAMPKRSERTTKIKTKKTSR